MQDNKEIESVCCYIIATHFGTYYTGITNNLIRRWSEHNKGKSRYLREFRAKEVLHIEFFNNRKAARKKEIQIKRVGAKKYLFIKSLSK